MNHRTLGKTGINVSEISLGTWQVGGKWGEPFDHMLADEILNTAVDQGVNFIDTADVYGDGNGESEQAVGRLVRSRSEQLYVASKCGRQLQPHVNEAYTPEALRAFVEASLKNMGLERIDLIQLHCPPTEVYYRPEIFELFERLQEEGKIGHLGVSVEKVEEALKAIEFPNVTTVQVIFNLFRQRPAQLLFREAARRNVGILARVPLASGLLTGKFGKDTTFGANDHRQFNRNGEVFDKGETFSGLDYALGLEVVNDLQQIVPNRELVHVALQWILNHPEVSCVIPGASKPAQVTNNLAATTAAPLTETEVAQINALYEEKVKTQVHHLW
ncbi:MAG TPA: aldo/keto reductase [Cytophagales bacterium]|nr:aldo/keto reductase [Cytophagales bacterium]